MSDTDGLNNYAIIRCCITSSNCNNFQLGDQTGTIAYEEINGRRKLQGTQTIYVQLFKQDIIGVALNLDNDEMTFYKNGTAQDSGTAFDISGVTNVSGNFFQQLNIMIAHTVVLILNFQFLVQPTITQSHQEIVMVMAMETLNILYHQDIMHLIQKI